MGAGPAAPGTSRRRRTPLDQLTIQKLQAVTKFRIERVNTQNRGSLILISDLGRMMAVPGAPSTEKPVPTPLFCESQAAEITVHVRSVLPQVTNHVVLAESCELRKSTSS